MRLAARPVGAASRQRRRLAWASASTARRVWVLPVPSPPVRIDTGAVSAICTPACCSGASRSWCWSVNQLDRVEPAEHAPVRDRAGCCSCECRRTSMRYALLAVLGQDGAAYDRLPNAGASCCCALTTRTARACRRGSGDELAKQVLHSPGQADGQGAGQHDDFLPGA